MMPLDRTTFESIHEIDPDGSLGLAKGIIATFMSQLPRELATLERYHNENSIENLAACAHRFKSSCNVVGAVDIARLLNQLEIQKNALSPENRTVILREIKFLTKTIPAELETLIRPNL